MLGNLGIELWSWFASLNVFIAFAFLLAKNSFMLIYTPKDRLAFEHFHPKMKNRNLLTWIRWDDSGRGTQGRCKCGWCHVISCWTSIIKMEYIFSSKELNSSKVEEHLQQCWHSIFIFCVIISTSIGPSIQSGGPDSLFVKYTKIECRKKYLDLHRWINIYPCVCFGY